MTRIGVFLPNWVGDVVMATPALRALRAHLGADAELIGIARPYVSEVLAGTTWLNDLVVYHRKSLRSMLGLVHNLRRRRLNSLLYFSNSMTSAMLGVGTHTHRRIGHAMHGRGWLLTDAPAQPRPGYGTPRSAVDHYLDVVQMLGCQVSNKRPELATRPTDRAVVSNLWRTFGWSDDAQVVIFNTGGAYGAAKVWPAEHFAALAQRMVDRRDIRVLFICGPAERADVARICCHVGDRRVQSLAGQTPSIGVSKACVQRARAMVTTDSGPRHFAAAFDVPVVTIFGPTDPRWSANYHANALNLQLDLSCSPCSRRICPEGHHCCMRDMSVEQVFLAASGLLDATEADRAA